MKKKELGTIMRLVRAAGGEITITREVQTDDMKDYELVREELLDKSFRLTLEPKEDIT